MRSTGVCSLFLIFVLIVGCGDEDSPGADSGDSPHGTDDSPSSDSSQGGEAYDPCAGKACGDSCTLCPPDGTEPCEENEEPKYCDADGECHGTLEACPDTGLGKMPEGCDFLSVTEDPPPCGDYPERCEQMAADGSRRLFQCYVRDDYYTADEEYVELSEEELAERVACVATWLENLDASDVSSGSSIVSATGDWDQLAPLIGVEGTICHPICGDSACDYCYDLDEEGCQGDAFCYPGFGSPIDLERGCIESSRFAICRPGGGDCAESETAALDEDGQCWYFNSICYDKGYTYIDPDDSDCRYDNYPSCDEL